MLMMMMILQTVFIQNYESESTGGDKLLMIIDICINSFRLSLQYTLFYKNIVYKNTEAHIC